MVQLEFARLCRTMMPIDDCRTSLSRAFMRWWADRGNALADEVRPRKRQGRVTMTFRRFPYLRGMVRANCLSVTAHGDMFKGDHLLALDSLPIGWLGDGKFHCGFCNEGAVYDYRVELWRDHLFEPFGEWVDQKLRKATNFDEFLLNSICAVGFTPAHDPPIDLTR